MIESMAASSSIPDIKQDMKNTHIHSLEFFKPTLVRAQKSKKKYSINIFMAFTNYIK